MFFIASWLFFTAYKEHLYFQVILIAIVVSFLLKRDPDVSDYERMFGKMKAVDMSSLDLDNIFVNLGKYRSLQLNL